MNQDQETLRVHLRESLLDILGQLQNLDSGQLDSISLRLEQIASHILRLCGVNLVDDEIQRFVSQALHCLQGVEEFYAEIPFVAESVHSGRRGRPSFNISCEQLNYFLNYQFSVKDIACALGVSQSTIVRRMRDNGLQIRQNTNIMSDEELDGKITQVLREFPNAGYRRVMSQLVVNGLKPSQIQVRESMRRVNPQGVALRWLRLTPRRQYRVSGPLALWHIDGNHKLIR
jgi:hypothetical protein